jgi:hypothetical protein
MAQGIRHGLQNALKHQLAVATPILNFISNTC